MNLQITFLTHMILIIIMFMSKYSTKKDKMSYSRNDKPHVTKDLR